ncbi:hypothetical protein [Cognaticolwellia beringensis]|uniref:Uncharacterized protein n=1 Tax=Cognaticolwellia beringensis TaxID=1967665 RepID=A0A222G4V9_9GAMM|nr:hypothetical protein [Cognaticolwellia beringensis]ASP46623.1 hypothetical protein B5D82_01800 [Cognaticolwellia beringensis]
MGELFENVLSITGIGFDGLKADLQKCEGCFVGLGIGFDGLKADLQNANAMLEGVFFVGRNLFRQVKWNLTVFCVDFVWVNIFENVLSIVGVGFDGLKADLQKFEGCFVGLGIGFDGLKADLQKCEGCFVGLGFGFDGLKADLQNVKAILG